FSAAPGANYQPMKNPNQPDSNTQVASDTAVGQTLAFKISGEGTLGAQQDGGGTQGESASGQAENRPGGGLGPPIDAPDPLQKYRWWFLGGFAAVLIIGGVFVASRQQARNHAARAAGGFSSIEDAEDFEVPATPRGSRAAATRAPSAA